MPGQAGRQQVATYVASHCNNYLPTQNLPLEIGFFLIHLDVPIHLVSLGILAILSNLQFFFNFQIF